MVFGGVVRGGVVLAVDVIGKDLESRGGVGDSPVCLVLVCAVEIFHFAGWYGPLDKKIMKKQRSPFSVVVTRRDGPPGKLKAAPVTRVMLIRNVRAVQLSEGNSVFNHDGGEEKRRGEEEPSRRVACRGSLNRATEGRVIGTRASL